MKNLLITAALFLYSLNLFGQLQNEIQPQISNLATHSRGDASISLSGNMIMNDLVGSQFAGGVKIRMFLGKRVSFDSDLAIGKDYLHFGPGIIGLPLWILGAELGFSSDDDDSFALFLFKLVAMALSAEHIAYHIPVKNSLDISPFISFLRFTQFSNVDMNIAPEDNGSPATFVAGLEFNQYFKRFILSPYAEYNIAYNGYFQGFNFGVNFGYYFPFRD